MKIIQLLLITLILIISNNQGCPTFPNNLQSGVLNIRQNPGQTQYNQNIQILNYLINRGYNIALSLNNFNFMNKTNLDFKIESSKQHNQQFFTIKFTILNSNWQQANIQYLISLNNQITVGSFNLNINQKIQTKFKYQIPNIFCENKQLKDINLYITGIKSKGLIKQLLISNIKINYFYLQGIINMDDLASIQSLQIDYIIYCGYYSLFQSIHPNFAMFKMIGIAGINQTLPIIRGFSIRRKLLCCSGSLCPYFPNNLIDTSVCKSQGGISSLETCYLCGKRQSLIQNQCRSTGCPQNQQQFNSQCDCKSGYVRRNGKCELNCLNGKISNGKTCLCSVGFIQTQSGSCFKCRDDQITSKNQQFCRCKGGFLEIQGTCVSFCQQNSQFNQQTRKCQCNKPLVNYNNKCFRCPQDGPVDPAFSYCQCRFSKYFSITKGQCTNILSCSSNQQFDQKTEKCKCRSGLVLIDNVCGYCIGNGQVYDSKAQKCSCQSDMIKDGFGVCRKCSQNSSPNPAGNKCRCPNGVQLKFYYLKCQSCPTGTFYSFSQLKCVCSAPNAKLFNGQCIECPNSLMVIQYGQCVCPQGYIQNSNRCQLCPHPTKPSSSKTSCICIQGFHKFDGITCSKCQDENSQLNQRTLSCQCKKGYYKSQINGNKCLFIPNNCPFTGFFNQTIQSCQCNDSNAEVKSALCACKLGFYSSQRQKKCVQLTFSCVQGSTFNIMLQRCQCTNHKAVVVNGRCVSCGQQQYLKDGKCICKPNAARIGQLCTDCGLQAKPNSDNTSCACQKQNEVFRGGQCQCKTGYYKRLALNNGCLNCPTNSTVNMQKNGCVCFDPQRVWDGLACQCPSSKVLTDQNQCKICKGRSRKSSDGKKCQCFDLGEQYNEFEQCVCKQNYFKYDRTCVLCPNNARLSYNKQTCYCIDRSKIFNGRQCVCGEHKIVTSSGTCRSCPTNSIGLKNANSCFCTRKNQIFNGKQCVCKDGFLIINGGCQGCPFSSLLNSQTGKCDCFLTNQIFSNNACICKENHFKINGICTKCRLNQIFNANSNACICVVGTKRTNGNCVGTITCKNTAIYNITFNRCDCPDINAQYSNQRCSCKSQYFLSSKTNLCIKQSVCNIPGTSYSQQKQTCICHYIGAIIQPSKNSCQCPKDTYNKTQNRQCSIIPPCDQRYASFNTTSQQCQCNVTGAFIDRSLSCICQIGFFINTTTYICQQINQCSINNTYFNKQQQKCICYDSNAEIVDGRCSCKLSFVVYFGRCVPKDRSLCTQLAAKWNPATQKCQCRDPNAEINGQNCSCKQGFFVGSNTGLCIQQGHCFDIKATQLNPVNGQCECIDPNANVVLNKCVCKQRFVRNQRGICQQKCTIKDTKPSIFTNKCQCLYPNAVLDLTRSQCVCPLGSRKDQVKKQCISGGQCASDQVFNDNFKTCQCPNQKIDVNGGCRDCPPDSIARISTCQCTKPHQIYQLGNCICQTSYIRINGVCSLCGQNQKLSADNTKCQCISGTSLTGTQCVGIPQCPSNSVLNSNKCVCTDNLSVFINGKCECRQGYYFSLKRSTCLPKTNCRMLSTEFNTTSQTCECIKNSIKFYGLFCGCKRGYIYSNSKCLLPLKCTIKGTVFNQNRNKCQCRTFSGLLTGNKCVCSLSSQYVSQRYQACINKPVCPPITQFNEDSQTCQCMIKRAVYDRSQGRCKCQYGFYLKINQCKSRLSCIAKGSTFNQNTQLCQCAVKGSVEVNLRCVCPLGQRINSVSNQCQQINTTCQEGYYHSIIFQQCIIEQKCIYSDTYFNKTVQQCVCQMKNAVLVNRQMCLCQDGFVRDVTFNQCKSVPQCGFGSTGKDTNGDCVCDARTAQLESFYKTCQCKAGFSHSGNRVNCQ